MINSSIFEYIKTEKKMENFNKTKKKSINRGEWFGVYLGQEWTLSTYRDGNKSWYYISINGIENDSPAENKDFAFKCIKENIELELN